MKPYYYGFILAHVKAQQQPKQKTYNQYILTYTNNAIIIF